MILKYVYLVHVYCLNLEFSWVEKVFNSKEKAESFVKEQNKKHSHRNYSLALVEVE